MKSKPTETMIFAVLMLMSVCACTPPHADTPGLAEPPTPDPTEEVVEQIFDGYVVRNSCAIIQTEEKSFELSGDYDAIVIPDTLESLTISDYRWDAIYYEGTPEQFQKLEIHRWRSYAFGGTWENAAYADRFFAGYLAADPADLDGEYEYRGTESSVFPTPVYYYSETEPAESGMWWRYNKQGLPTVWENSLEYDPEIHPSETVVIRGSYAFVKDGAEDIGFRGEYDGVVLPTSVKSISLGYRWYAVFYKGTSEQFKEIECYFGDSAAWADRAFMGYAAGNIEGRYEYRGGFGFQPTPVYYYSETEPAEPGMYWRYDDEGFPVPWENNLEFDPTPTMSLTENVILLGRYAIVKDGVERFEESLYSIDGVVISPSVKSIRLEDLWPAVFYRGTPEQFQKIRCYTDKYVAWADRAFTGYANRKGDIDGEYEYIGASGFHDVPVYYYSETKPASEGMYWHYDADGFPIVWE